MTREQLHEPRLRLRSPLVTQCLDDYLAGVRHPLSLISHLIDATRLARRQRLRRPPARPGYNRAHDRGSQRVVLALSGGVDSAVAAALLKDAGHDVHALFMRNWDEDEDGYCTAAADLQDARRVCESISTCPCTRSISPASTANGCSRISSTNCAPGARPNPDVACNREIKFGVCFEHARRLGARWFATGHYARSATVDGRPRLLRAADRDKDQTYFLHTVPGTLLARTLFPIGHLDKTEVRRIAHERALPVHDKRDSTGICFIGERPFAEFLAAYLPAQPGAIETTEGRVLGEHRGLMYYTLGQRQGLLLGGVRGAAEAPWYVARQGPRPQRARRHPAARRPGPDVPSSSRRSPPTGSAEIRRPTSSPAR